MKSTKSALYELFSQTDLNVQEDCYTSLISLDSQNTFDRLPWIATIQLLQDLKVETSYLSTVR